MKSKHSGKRSMQNTERDGRKTLHFSEMDENKKKLDRAEHWLVRTRSYHVRSLSTCAARGRNTALSARAAVHRRPHDTAARTQTDARAAADCSGKARVAGRHGGGAAAARSDAAAADTERSAGEPCAWAAGPGDARGAAAACLATWSPGRAQSQTCRCRPARRE
jgi:hypothetical protein